jgi:hypothetical protein
LNAVFAGGLSTPTGNNPTAPDNTFLLPNGLRSTSINPSTWFGTNAINLVMPTIICDPTKHAAGAYFNPNCFGMPAYGQQGALIWPNLRGPSYFDSDLGIYKSFKITEAQSVQFRVSATNFLNHPLPQFGLAGVSDEQLNFQTSTNGGNAVSQTNTNSTTTGKPAFKNGSRQVTFALKYYF